LDLRNGSQLRLTGVCRVEESSFPGTGFRVSPRTIELLLRTPADIVAVSMPTWWTTQRLAFVASGLLVLAVIALAWIVLLRRRVADQTEVIRQKVQREAALEERHRMAREIHDTLAQSFSGLGFQLNAINAELPPNVPDVKARLETARQMVRHGQEEFRRSLMNLRAQELERGGLAQALPEVARQMVSGTSINLECEIDPQLPSLSEAVEANLLRIGQECLTNAVRHAHPRKIKLALHRMEKTVHLQIADDGEGFVPEQNTHSSNGHFGWRGIRERAEQIHAKVELNSSPGAGTTVSVTVPI
jgi:signal transduction histidine kinase